MAEEKRSLECLPEECIAHIISFASPRDACSASMVSSHVRAAADSDYVWERFLPLGYGEVVLSRTVSELEFSCKKDLFAKFSSSPVLIDGGTKTFSIDKCTNKKRYMLGGRELSITWGSNPLCWCWKPLSYSRFPQAVELIMVSWLEIRGKISTKTLSPNTTYGAYLVLQVTKRAFGLSARPFEAAVKYGGESASSTQKKTINMDNAVTNDGSQWWEIELGGFYSGHGEEVVEMWFRETKGEQLKGGIVVEGIDLKPKD